MRISSRMYADFFLSDLQAHQQRLFELQRVVATGKRILTPSDDPVGAQQVAATINALSANQQYQSNVSDAKTIVEQAASVAKAAGKTLADAIVTAQRGANDSNTASARTALAAAIDQLLETALDTGNDHSLSRYTLAGTHTSTPPFVATRDGSGKITAVALDPAVTTDAINRQIDKGNILKVNLNAADIFGGTGAPPGSIDYFASLIQLRDALAANDGNAVRALVPQLQTLHEQVSAQEALAGSRWQRLDDVQTKLEDQAVVLQSNRSRVEDIDTASAAADLQAEQLIYQQALAVGNRILQMGLGQLLG
ncbi:MAG: hypothetical protein HZB25_08950 [Candidatus Eisenbacteria bacterium]|nr:hypothetical protein [Candidatus Eisenbacteria bacterium]